MFYATIKLNFEALYANLGVNFDHNLEKKNDNNY